MPWGDFENLGKKIQFWVKTCSYNSINTEKTRSYIKNISDPFLYPVM